MDNLNDSEITVLNDNKAKCLVCENDFELDFDDVLVDGIENLDDLKQYIEANPNAKIFYNCPHCLMEYVFAIADGKLILVLSEEEK